MDKFKPDVITLWQTAENLDLEQGIRVFLASTLIVDCGKREDVIKFAETMANGQEKGDNSLYGKALRNQ